MKAFSVVLILMGSFSTLLGQGKPNVMVMEIKDEIDTRMLRYVRLSLEHAEKTKADYVIIEIGRAHV